MPAAPRGYRGALLTMPLYRNIRTYPVALPGGRIVAPGELAEFEAQNKWGWLRVDPTPAPDSGADSGPSVESTDDALLTLEQLQALGFEAAKAYVRERGIQEHLRSWAAIGAAYAELLEGVEADEAAEG